MNHQTDATKRLSGRFSFAWSQEPSLQKSSTVSCLTASLLLKKIDLISEVHLSNSVPLFQTELLSVIGLASMLCL